MKLYERISTMQHAFPNDERKAEVRRLSAEVALLETVRQAAFVVVFECGKPDAVLMLKHKKPEVEGKWGMPGGKLELGDFQKEGNRSPFERAAVRELEQETGLISGTDYEHLRAMPAVCADFRMDGLFVTIHPFWAELTQWAVPELREPEAHSEKVWVTLYDEDILAQLPQPQIHPITAKVIARARMLRDMERNIRNGL